MKETEKTVFDVYAEILGDYEDLLAGNHRRPRPRETPRITAMRPGPAPGPEAHGGTGEEAKVAGAAGTSSAAAPTGGTPDERRRLLEALAGEVGTCRKCGLASGRNRAVPGTGVLDPLVMVIGEGPGADEDRSGLPFVGAAGQFLDKWLQAVGLSRKENAYIANIVKCRPPGNRDPEPEEMTACLPYLDRQVALVRPKAILAVGRVAAKALLGSAQGIGALRGKRFDFRGIPLVATYHPSAVLRDMNLKRPVWEDLKLLKDVFEAAVRDEHA